MALIKCPECGRGMSDTVPECPGCAYSLHAPALEAPVPPPPRRVRKQWLWLALAPAALLGIGLVIASVASHTIRHASIQSPFTESQREAAQGFWDTVVDQYIKIGLIGRYEPRDGMFVMYVRGPQWRLLSLEDKKAFVANLSKSNAILGQPSYVEIRDEESGKVYAVTRSPEKNEIYE